MSVVRKCLSTLNVRKASGLDGISQRLLKDCASGLAESVCHIFNLSLCKGVFPRLWKLAVIQPVPKQEGERSNPKCYRPIALLSCMAKQLEACVRKQLLEFCLDNGLIPDEQFGFLSKRSTVWQLLSVMDDWLQALDTGHCVHAGFLDVAKAFDRVDHGLLLLKLSTLGIRGVALSWFESYLRGRLIRTRVDGVLSDVRLISSGVPQGSVLGPLLFVLYFSDLPLAVRASCSLYADDTLVFDSTCSGDGSSSCCELRRDLVSVGTWARAWNTTFNASKSNAMLVHARNVASQTSDVELDSAVIPGVRVVCHLGVMLTESLGWSHHISFLLRRVSPSVGLLRHLAYRVGSALLVKRLYVGLVRQVLEYASPVWDSCTKSETLSLERLQLSVARAVLRVRRSSMSNSKVLEAVGWPTLAWRRRRFKLLLLWRLIHGEGPPSLAASLPQPAADRSSRCLRNPHSLAYPYCKSTRRCRSFLPSSIGLWNCLPTSVTSCSSSCSFLTSLDQFYKSDKFSFGLS